MPLDKIRPTRIVQWIQRIDCQEDLTLALSLGENKADCCFVKSQSVSNRSML